MLEEGAGWLGQAEELERALAQAAGARARVLASFARCRPSAWDRQPGERGAASAASRAARPAALVSVSEWAVAEVAARLRLTEQAASDLLATSVELVAHLPATLAALEAGSISWLHARALVELLGPVSEQNKPLVEARVLPRAGGQTVAQLRECTTRAIARIDAEAAARRIAAAIRGRTVVHQPGPDGMDTITVHLPAPVARACQEALRAYARASAATGDGQRDPRCLDERMADTFADLLLRPDAEGRPHVQVILNVVATVGALTGTGPDADEPGEIDGHLVPAVLVRELAYTLGLLPRQATPTDLTDTEPTNTQPTRPKPAGTEPTTSAGVDGSSPEAAAALEKHLAQLRAHAGDATQADAQRAAAVRQAVQPLIETTHHHLRAMNGHPPARPAGGPPPLDADSGDRGDRRTTMPGAGAGADPQPAAPASGVSPADDAARERQLAAAAAATQARKAMTDLLDLTRLTGTTLAQRPRIAITDELTGALLALATSTELRAAAHAGRGLDPPPETPGHTPSDALDRFCRLRDRRCLFPGCRARIRRGHLHHRTPYPHGPTTHDNLDGLCPFHHRLDHQAPGWTLTAGPDGGLTWTLPGATTITTAPPRFGTDDGNTPTPKPETDPPTPEPDPAPNPVPDPAPNPVPDPGPAARERYNPFQQLPEHLRSLRGSQLAAYFAGLPYQDLPPTSEDYAPLPF